MKIGKFSFGAIEIDGVPYEHDVVIDHKDVAKRSKKPSKKYRETFGHTPLSVDERIPWNCSRLVIGTGAYGKLPVMDEVKREADHRGVELVILSTPEAIELLKTKPQSTNAILHLTC